jgi:hypothetical protein
MKSYWAVVVFAGVVVAGAAEQGVPVLGQENGTPVTDARRATLKNVASGPDVLPSGANLVVELTKPINSKKVKPGDEVKAVVTQDLMSRGQVVVPRDSRLVGHVTDAKARTKEDPESRLGIVFDRVFLKGGTEVGCHAVVQALAPSNGRIAAVDESDPMIVMANDRSAKMMPKPDPGNRTSEARSIPPKINLSSSKDIESPASVGGPWTNGSRLESGNRGVFGFPELLLSSDASSKGSVISSIKSDIKLESGTQMVVRVVNTGQ